DRRLRLAMIRLRAFLSGHFTTMVLAGNPPTMERVMSLRPSFRAAFLARHVEELPPEKAAAKLGIPVATLEERLSFAYETLGCSERTDFAILRRPL
ncbi:MAG TPA: sigma factor-like helix-turn-helix DNA-binding protein, partial [Planctomycetota bacterium]|nr:sigma factor-like helix-turn-helix DNA-binding protein [Planctomycetota bacterium]